MQSFCNKFSTVLFQDSKHVGKIVDVDDDGGVGASGDVTETSNVTGAKLKVDADAKQKLVDKSEDSPSAVASLASACSTTSPRRSRMSPSCSIPSCPQP